MKILCLCLSLLAMGHTVSAQELPSFGEFPEGLKDHVALDTARATLLQGMGIDPTGGIRFEPDRGVIFSDIDELLDNPMLSEAYFDVTAAFMQNLLNRYDTSEDDPLDSPAPTPRQRDGDTGTAGADAPGPRNRDNKVCFSMVCDCGNGQLCGQPDMAAATTNSNNEEAERQRRREREEKAQRDRDDVAAALRLINERATDAMKEMADQTAEATKEEN